MSKKLEIVDRLSIERPCTIDDFATRAGRIGNDWYCDHCERRVFNLATMSRNEIARLIEHTDGEFCASITRRRDGSIVTTEASAPGRVFLAAGALFASTALLSGAAEAEETIGKVAVESPTPTPEPTPSAAAEEKEVCEASPSAGEPPPDKPELLPRRGRVVLKRPLAGDER